MDSMAAYVMGQANRGNRVKVFDWEKAARLIKEVKPSYARAGLAGDWEWTGGDIYSADGIPDEDDTYVYLASTWATPELDMDGDVQDCWLYKDESPDWDSGTYWPPEALEILGMQVKGTTIEAEVINIEEDVMGEIEA